MCEHLFACGTLRPSLAPPELKEMIGQWRWIVAGYTRGRLYDLGEYPGAILDPDCDATITGEVFQLPDASATLSALDAYEGFDPRDPDSSLFARRKCEVALDDGAKLECWMYVYNRQAPLATLITSGDYLLYKQEREI